MRRVAIAALLLLCLPSAARAQMPDTPAGRQLAAWLEAFNAERHEPLEQFVERHVPASARHMLLEASPPTFDFRARTGGFDFRKADTGATPTHLAAFVQERGSERFARIVIDVDSGEPHRVSAMSIAPTDRPAELALPRLSEPALVAALRERLDREAAAGRFAGAVLVARDGRTLFEGAYGLADREHGTPNTVDTRFRIGSMNKMFTAVAVLQLAQAGKLRLDAPLGTYLTDYPNRDIASKVTIHQLLTHTGGTGDFFGPEFDAHRLSLRTLDDYVKLFGARGPAFEPGERFEYSNYGFLLLGRVIEKASGMSYYDYVDAHVFAPAGMTSTGSLPEEMAVAGLSRGYMRGPTPAALAPNDPTLPYRGTSAGGGYSTVRDLSRFASALRAHTLLDAAHTDLLITGKVDARGARYAYGFFDRITPGGRFVGHGGGAPGMNGDLQIDPRTGYVVAVLSNLDPPAAQLVSEFVLPRLPMEASAK